MARRSELLGIGHNVHAAFISRNNDLNGYWALGQLRNWIEDKRAVTLDIPLIGGSSFPTDPVIHPISQCFSELLQTCMKSNKLPLGWVQDARFNIDLITLDRLNCSLRIISDLGRPFEFSSTLLVNRHDPSRELKSNRRMLSPGR